MDSRRVLKVMFPAARRQASIMAVASSEDAGTAWRLGCGGCGVAITGGSTRQRCSHPHGTHATCGGHLVIVRECPACGFQSCLPLEAARDGLSGDGRCVACWEPCAWPAGRNSIRLLVP